jgi:hypothetical protein
VSTRISNSCERPLGKRNFTAQRDVAHHAAARHDVQVDPVDRCIVHRKHPLAVVGCAHLHRQAQPDRLAPNAQVRMRRARRPELVAPREHLLDRHRMRGVVQHRHRRPAVYDRRVRAEHQRCRRRAHGDERDQQQQGCAAEPAQDLQERGAREVGWHGVARRRRKAHLRPTSARPPRT